MARPAHPRAMAPSRPGATRTAPPQMPASWWSAPRIRKYLLFDATGVVYLLLGRTLRAHWPALLGTLLVSLAPLFVKQSIDYGL